MSQVSELEAQVLQHEQRADLAWSQYHWHTELAHVYQRRLAEAKKHERRVEAVDEALRRTG